MIGVRKLTEEGLQQFRQWLETSGGVQPPQGLINGEVTTELIEGFEVDPEKLFETRQQFGVYLNEQFKAAEFSDMTAKENDGLWAWLAVIYFSQLTKKKICRVEHYIVVRQGSVGSLAYRHSVRTPYELVHVHGEGAMVCLNSRIDTMGEMTENFASRQKIAHNKGFFQAAFNLYLLDGKLRRGAASKPKKPKDRKPGDKTGFGCIRRLALALQRLNLTYDTEIMLYGEMVKVLPKEFAKWSESN